MVKLIVICFVASLVSCAKAQWEPEGVAGQVGEYCQVSDCETNTGGSCSESRRCCCPNTCWIHGECAPKVSETITEEGLIAISGNIGELKQYDSCENSRGRRGDDCTNESDCCLPLSCDGGKCSASETILAQIGKYMSGGGK